MTLVRLAKEEEGVGISAGAHLAGVKSAMLMQYHGFLAAVNGIVSGAQLYRIPLLMLISHRGTFGGRDPWQTEGGAVTEDLDLLPSAIRDLGSRTKSTIYRCHQRGEVSIVGRLGNSCEPGIVL